ncbi:MAG: BTAD domain-containing putative transcriptional regulator [Gemmatimonadaceae bacterium]
MHTLTTLGGLSIVGPNGLNTRLAPRKRALALLTLAASSAKEGISRDRAMALLWPELDTASARNNLKQTVFAIRQVLEVEMFDRTSPNLRLQPREITVDLHHFEHALAVGAHEEAVGDYTGPFLDGFFLPNLVEFDRWVERVRQRLDLGYARALESLAVRARLRSDVSAAIHWYRRLVEYDPVSTSSVLGLMLTLVAASEPLEALRYYSQHVKLLRDEFDAKPSPKIELAAERIRQDLTYRMSGTAPSAPADVSADVADLPTLFADSPSGARRNSGPNDRSAFTSGPIRLFGRNSGPTLIPGRTSGPTKLPLPPRAPNN